MTNANELPEVKYREYAKILSKRLGRRINIRDMYNWLVYNRHPMPQDVLTELAALLEQNGEPANIERID